MDNKSKDYGTIIQELLKAYKERMIKQVEVYESVYNENELLYILKIKVQNA